MSGISVLFDGFFALFTTSKCWYHAPFIKNPTLTTDFDHQDWISKIGWSLVVLQRGRLMAPFVQLIVNNQNC